MGAVEEFCATMLARHIEAEEAFVRGDPGPRMALWSRRDPVTLFGAIGMSESGWDRLSETFTWVASRFSDVSDFRIDVELVEVTEHVSYVLWFERWYGAIAGRPVEPITVRVTHVYRLEDGEWRIVHRHADNPAIDPPHQGGGIVTMRNHTEPAEPAIMRRPGDGQAVEGPVGRLTYRARGAETGGAMTAIETVAAPGEGPPLHVHVTDNEFIYVVAGRLRVKLAEDVSDAPAGSFVFIPKGLPHTWQAAGNNPSRFLFGFTPASVGMERFFERAAELGAETRLAEAFQRFAGDAGMEVLGLPLAESHGRS